MGSSLGHATSIFRNYPIQLQGVNLGETEQVRQAAIIEQLPKAVERVANQFAAANANLGIQVVSINPEVLSVVLKSNQPSVKKAIDQLLNTSNQQPNKSPLASVGLGVDSNQRLHVNIGSMLYRASGLDEGLLANLNDKLVTYGQLNLGEGIIFQGDISTQINKDDHNPNQHHRQCALIGRLTAPNGVDFKGKCYLTAVRYQNTSKNFLTQPPYAFELLEGELSWHNAEQKLTCKGKWTYKISEKCLSINSHEFLGQQLSVSSVFEGDCIIDNGKYRLFSKGTFNSSDHAGQSVLLRASKVERALGNCYELDGIQRIVNLFPTNLTLKKGDCSFIALESFDEAGKLSALGFMTGTFDEAGQIVSGMVTHPNGDVTDGVYERNFPDITQNFLTKGKFKEAATGKAYSGEFAYIPQLFRIALVNGVIYDIHNKTHQSGKFVYSPELHDMVPEQKSRMEALSQKIVGDVKELVSSKVRELKQWLKKLETVRPAEVQVPLLANEQSSHS